MKRALLTWISVGLGIGSMISCASTEDGRRGPVENAPRRQREVPASSGAEIPSSATPTAAASASKKPSAGPQDALALPCDAHHLPAVGDPPPHALSQHVPDRACSEESECGDGFCDRGRCAPIWNDWYGLQCTMNCQCGPFLCSEGRCRSCLHHTECVEHGNVCTKDVLFTTVPFANVCAALGIRETRMPPEPVRPPPPPIP